MFSYIKNAVSSFIFEESVETNSFDVLDALNKDSFPTSNDVLTNEGEVSHITDEFGMIDNKYSFSVSTTYEKLKAGDRVWYSYMPHALGEDSRRIVNIKLMADEETEELWDEALAEDQDIVTVKEREGRLVFFSNDIICDLDEVSVDQNFLPECGDVVKVDSCTDEATCLVLKISPFHVNNNKGVVVELRGNMGFINDSSIWFNRDVLQSGYEPIVGDNVQFSAIENTKKDITTWRAISVRFHSIDDSVINDDWPLKEEDDVLAITGTTDFGEVLMASSKSLILKVSNRNKAAFTLNAINFRREQQQISVSGITLPCAIAPNSFVSITFTCHPVFVGRNSEVVDFCFDDFQISRRFEMIVSCLLVNGNNTGSAPLRKKYGVQQELMDIPENRTYGPKPFQKKLYRKCCKYGFPPNIKAVFDENHALERDLSNALLEKCPILTVDLQYANYTEKFHTLLFIEQMSVQKELLKLSKAHVFLRKSGEYLVLDMPGLAEQRPSLIIGDKVVVTQPWSESNKIAHVGIIHFVGRDSISIKFHESFHNIYNQTDCNVQFQQGSAAHYLHDAVKKANLNLKETILFPTALSPKLPKFHVTEDALVWHNKTLNRGQRSAVVSILAAQCRPLPYIVFGPPGTGKTVTVVEAILQIVRCFASSRLLVAAPSNSAADLLATRIINDGGLSPGQLIRIYAYSRQQESIPEELMPYAAIGYDEDTNGNVSDVAIGWHRITVGTCASLASLHLQSLPAGHFTHIVVDEAGYATEPQILVPLTFLEPSSGVAVLAGDPEQLGPVVLSSVCTRMGLAESFMSRIIERFPYKRDLKCFPNTQGYDPRVVGKLTLNYRSVPEILSLPSKLFYNNELSATVSGKIGRESEIIQEFNKHFPIRKEPLSILFHGIRGQNLQEDDSPSWFNPQELFHTIQYVRVLYSLGIDPSELGIVTPYRKQALQIRKLLEAFDLELPKVGSVEEFQGQERQIIIMSCVRSQYEFVDNDKKFALGFIKNPKRVNVSLTRARCLLVILGNPHLLSTDPYWRSVIMYCLEIDAYTGCDIPKNLDKIISERNNGNAEFTEQCNIDKREPHPPEVKSRITNEFKKREVNRVNSQRISHAIDDDDVHNFPTVPESHIVVNGDLAGTW